MAEAAKWGESVMGHQIQAVIGQAEAVAALAVDWPRAEVVPLPQGFAMVFLTAGLWDAVEEAFPGPAEPDVSFLLCWSGAVRRWLEGYSCCRPLAYIETDYFGGCGTQAGVLVEKGRVAVPPVDGAGTIDRLLAALGVRCLPGKDEFDSLGLGSFRHMPDME